MKYYYTSKNDWYSDWEKENDDWLEYLARDVQPVQPQNPQRTTTPKNVAKNASDAMLNGKNSEEQSSQQAKEYRQMSLFELFPDGFIKQDVALKKATPKKSKGEKRETKEEKIIRTANQLQGSWDDLDKVISSLETEAKLKHNVFIDFHGEKLYSLLDNRDSCYQKVTGLDYETYCRYEPYIEE